MKITTNDREIELDEMEIVATDVYALLSSVFLQDQIGAGKLICDKYLTKEQTKGLTNWELVSLYNKVALTFIETSSAFNPKFTNKGDDIEIDFTEICGKDLTITISKNFELQNCMTAMQTMTARKPIEAGFGLFDMEAIKYPRYNEVTSILADKTNGKYIAALIGLNMCGYIEHFEYDVKKN